MVADRQAKVHTLAVFAHLNGQFEPAGLLDMTEQGAALLASSFRYGCATWSCPMRWKSTR